MKRLGLTYVPQSVQCYVQGVIRMQVTSISDFRKDAKKYFDQVIEDQDILLITRTDGKTTVMMTLDEYNSKTETEYLLSNSVNAERLKRSLKDAAEGKVVKHKLIDV